ncbi:MAG: T9SS type A sorting domain-containing protein [Chitinophagales bacterium]|nr:T9SS type A sorting domain-containing protein [Chitinophagales bacterium]
MKLILFIVLAFFVEFAYSQAPEIEWQNTIGGGSSDNLSCISLCHDGGYIIGGSSGSTIFGDKSEDNIGYLDYWVVKLDSVGNILWQNTIGGSLTDILTSVIETNDKGFLVGGYSESGISGDKSELNFGSDDYWVVKLDSVGNILWQNTIGGSSSDQLTDIIQTHDDGFLIGGRSSSNISGDKTENAIGGTDYWVVKLDSVGNILWQNTIGGLNFEELYELMQTEKGDYLIGGNSNSGISGDKTEASILNPFGLNTHDYWIVEIDSIGNIIWQNTIGGNDADYNYTLDLISNDGLITGGSSKSNISADKTSESFGDLDYWIVALDTLGNVEWQNDFGGNNSDYLKGIIQTFDKGFALVGYSLSGSTGNKVEGNYGMEDYWIIKVDTLGNISWQNSLQGTGSDFACCIIQAPDGGFLVGGTSDSNISPDKNEDNIGNGDYWIVKFYPEDCTLYTFYKDFDEDGYGSMGDSVVACYIPDGFVENNFDCNDFNPMIHPDQGDSCNDIDDNCNGILDEDATFTTYFLDYDEDGYGNPLIDTISCSTIMGFVLNDDDCDDSNPLVYPGAIELENGVDDNCNGSVDEGFNYIENIDTSIYKIFPNPNTGEFKIYVNSSIIELLVIKIYSITGELLYYSTFLSSNEIKMSLPEAFSGLYLLSVVSDKVYIFPIEIIK